MQPPVLHLYLDAEPTKNILKHCFRNGDNGKKIRLYTPNSMPVQGKTAMDFNKQSKSAKNRFLGQEIILGQEIKKINRGTDQEGIT